MTTIQSFVLSIGLGLAIGVTAWGQSTTTFLTQDACFVMRLNVAQLKDYLPADSEQLKALQDGMLETAGFSLADLEQIVIQVGGELNMDNGSVPDATTQLSTYTLRFSRPQEFETIVKNMFQCEIETKEIDGRKMFIPEYGFMPAAAIADDHTLIFGFPERLEVVLTSEHSMGLVIDLLAEVPEDADAVVAFERNETLATIIDSISDELSSGLPYTLADMLSKAAYGVITVELSDDTPLRGDISAKNIADAEKLADSLQALIDLCGGLMPMAKQSLDGMKETFEEIGDDSFQKMMEGQIKVGYEMVDLGGKVFAALKSQPDGSNVRLSAEIAGGIPEAVRLVTASLAISFTLVEDRIESDPELIDDDLFDDQGVLEPDRLPR